MERGSSSTYSQKSVIVQPSECTSSRYISVIILTSFLHVCLRLKSDPLLQVSNTHLCSYIPLKATDVHQSRSDSPMLGHYVTKQNIDASQHVVYCPDNITHTEAVIRSLCNYTGLEGPTSKTTRHVITALLHTWFSPALGCGAGEA
jgi:hypothetical protein